MVEDVSETKLKVIFVWFQHIMCMCACEGGEEKFFVNYTEVQFGTPVFGKRPQAAASALSVAQKMINLTIWLRGAFREGTQRRTSPIQYFNKLH